MRDRGAQAVQSFAMDFFPLIVLFAISITGLALTVSQAWLRGASYSFLAILHAITVIAGLLFLPFGKFFHIFQRPAQLGVKLYQEAGAPKRGSAVRALRRAFRIEDAHRRSAHESAARAWVSIIAMEGKVEHWQGLCPACKRKSLASAQIRMKERIVAKLPASLADLTKRFGPHPQLRPRGRWQDESRNPADRLVKTHCCFCGQQCGIQLKVRENKVIGFEPWEEFPFNRGKLCPKGVKRYLQSNHPDRLLDPLMRDDQGFREAELG